MFRHKSLPSSSSGLNLKCVRSLESCEPCGVCVGARGHCIVVWACRFSYNLNSTSSGSSAGGGSVSMGAASASQLSGFSNSSSGPLRPSAPPAIEVSAPTPVAEKKQARVLYDYDAADSSELSLLADEVTGAWGWTILAPRVQGPG